MATFRYYEQASAYYYTRHGENAFSDFFIAFSTAVITRIMLICAGQFAVALLAISGLHFTVHPNHLLPA